MTAPNAKPRAGEHTKGPWKISGTGFVVADGKVVAIDISEANAQRIVACVNACEGISTETLKNGFALNAYQSFDALAAQNRELVEALEELVTRCDGAEGVRADGSNIQTMRASAVLTKHGR